MVGIGTSKGDPFHAWGREAKKEEHIADSSTSLSFSASALSNAAISLRTATNCTRNPDIPKDCTTTKLVRTSYSTVHTTYIYSLSSIEFYVLQYVSIVLLSYSRSTGTTERYVSVFLVHVYFSALFNSFKRTRPAPPTNPSSRSWKQYIYIYINIYSDASRALSSVRAVSLSY